jgi:hypothetical protein
MGRAVAQAVSFWLPTAEPGFNPRPIPMGFVVDEVALGQVFLRVLLFLSIIIIPSVLHICLAITDAILAVLLTAFFNKTCKKRSCNVPACLHILYMKLLNRSQCNLMVQIGLNSVRQI